MCHVDQILICHAAPANTDEGVAMLLKERWKMSSEDGASAIKANDEDFDWPDRNLEDEGSAILANEDSFD